MKNENQTNIPGKTKTPQKRLSGGRVSNLPPGSGKNFTKDYQPAPKAKSEGWKKRKFSRTVIAEMLSMKYKFTPESFKQGVAKQLKEAFGDMIHEMTIGEIMSAQQVQKAILKGDTIATTNLFNQAYGLPKQDLDVKSGGEKIGEVDYNKLSDEVLQAIIDAARTNEK